ncbi:MAG: N-acetylglucosamine-6-phosphate deacetylase [Terrimonas sp.]|nr:N-acetylglucosamine-6-phosphate deacetylase [Terrimonas sp.]
MLHSAYYNIKIYTGLTILEGKAILTEEGIIRDIIPESEIPGDYEKIDLEGKNLAPAFIDLQIYGGNGQLFAHHLSLESLEKTYQYCSNGGCHHFMITIATNSDEVVYKGIETVRDYWNKGGKGLLGLHLEGPYIHPQKRGAHKTEFIQNPEVNKIKQLLEAGRGIIKMITLAPERCDDAIIRLLLDNGIILSAGHSLATYQQARHGFDLGIPLATHLFNAMSPFQGREPGMVGAIYHDTRVMSSIVADGIHVDFAAVNISMRIMGDRLFLITDAVTTITEGPYHHLFKEDRYVLPDGTLSGSSLTMMQAVKNCVLRAGIALDEALRMATAYPAKAIGGDKRLGYILPGYEAAFVVFDDDFQVISTIHP